MLHPNRRLLTISLIAVSFTAAAVALLAQQQTTPPAQTPASSGAVFRSDTRVVVLQTTVVDKNGHLVTDLPKSAFTVYENGVQQQITGFKREDIPVSLGLVIDNSGSMRDKRAKVAAAATGLVKASNKDDEEFVVNFNDEAFLDLPHNKEFTNDITELEEALSRIDSRGGTAMRDAIRMSIEHLKEKAHLEKKVIVVVTDGNDNSSNISLESLIKAAQQSGVLIYSMGLLSDEERRDALHARHALEDLAKATGGEAFFPKDVSEVDRFAQEVAHDLRNQYTIQYTPSDAAMDGTFRAIKMVVRAPGNPTPHTRSGYYATPDQSAPPAKSQSFKQ
jgi:Ca-activated chloride channel homolog